MVFWKSDRDKKHNYDFTIGGTNLTYIGIEEIFHNINEFSSAQDVYTKTHVWNVTNHVLRVKSLLNVKYEEQYFFYLRLKYETWRPRKLG